MATKKATTKQDLENKIAELEAKLNNLSIHLEVDPDDVNRSQVKPSEVTKSKGTLPQGSDVSSTDTKKSNETKAQLSTTITAGNMIF